MPRASYVFLVNTDLTPSIEMNNADECCNLNKKNAEIVLFIDINASTTMKTVMSRNLTMLKYYSFSFAISLSSKPARNSSLICFFLCGQKLT